MRYLSLFSGIGGFELGIQQAYEHIFNEMELGRCRQKEGNVAISLPNTISESNQRQYPTCIGYSEIDKYAIQVYEKHFKHKNWGDITKIIASKLPDFDFLCGGFPCQAFSIAGKRRGFEDTRGTLFFDIARILSVKKPRLFLLENVKGLLSHDNGRTFKTIITTLDELGYDLQWQVLNSKNFGVPQNRERVFIIGHSRGTSRPEVFPFGGNDGICAGRGKEGKQAQQQVEQNTKGRRRYTKCDASQGMRVYGTEGISTTIASQAGGLGAKTGLYQMEKMKIRRLTPIECERLQGFPDSWTEEGTQGKVSDTQRYKMCGNAVTVNVIREIMKQINA